MMPQAILGSLRGSCGRCPRYLLSTPRIRSLALQGAYMAPAVACGPEFLSGPRCVMAERLRRLRRARHLRCRAPAPCRNHSCRVVPVLELDASIEHLWRLVPAMSGEEPSLERLPAERGAPVLPRRSPATGPEKENEGTIPPGSLLEVAGMDGGRCRRLREAADLSAVVPAEGRPRKE